MDAAITSICQETLPLEVDMTSFLLSSCGHMQKLVSQARKELTVAKEVDLGRKHSVRFLEVVEIQRWVDVTDSLILLLFVYVLVTMKGKLSVKKR